jgi:hypothetical protein
MKRMQSRSLGALALFAIACGDDGSQSMPSSRTVTPSAFDAGPLPADGEGECTIAPDCADVSVKEIVQKACCTQVFSCGYLLTEPSAETLMLFPQITDVYNMVAKDDPNRRCAAESFFYGTRPGLYEHRVEPDSGDDILITPSCDSFTLAAFILPGCCLPDNTCGLSTDESWPTLEYLSDSSGFPFERPQCVTAETLNAQFRDSGTLAAFARTRSGGTCNYAELDAQLPKWTD